MSDWEQIPAPLARRWLADRALPILSGEMPVPDAIRQAIRPPATPTANALAYARARAPFDPADALRSYRLIPASDPWGIDALVERGWLAWELGELGEARGVAWSLRAPWVPTSIRWESLLLEAAVAQRQCRTDDALRSLDGLVLTPAETESLARTDPLLDRLGQLQRHPSPDWTGEQRQRLDDTIERRLSRRRDEAASRVQDLRARAEAIRFETLDQQRQFALRGVRLQPRPTTHLHRHEDEAVWPFDGTWWRSDMGHFRIDEPAWCPPGEQR